MVDGAMPGEVLGHGGIHGGVIGHDIAGLVDFLGDDRAWRAFPTVLIGLFAADIGFVDFNNLVRAAERAKPAVTHGLTNAMAREPCRFVGQPEHAMDLVGADALLAANHQMQDQQPLVERDMRALKHGADRDGELLLAALALVDAGAVFSTLRAALAVKLVSAADQPAMRAYWRIAPQ